MTTQTTPAFTNLYEYTIYAMQNPTDLDHALNEHGVETWLGTTPRIKDGILRRDIAEDHALCRFRADHAGAEVEVRHCRPEDKQEGARLVYSTKGILGGDAVTMLTHPTENSTKIVPCVLVTAAYGVQVIPMTNVIDIEVV